MTDERLASPVAGDVTEHPMLNFVPFARAGWKVANHDGDFFPVRPVLYAFFPKSAARGIAAPTVTHDEDFFCLRVKPFTHFLPPTSDTVHGKLRSIVVGADTHPAEIVAWIIDSIRDCLAEVFIDKVVCLDLSRLTTWCPFSATILIIAY